MIGTKIRALCANSFLKIYSFLMPFIFRAILKTASLNFHIFRIRLQKNFLKTYRDRSLSYSQELAHVVAIQIFHEKIPHKLRDFFDQERQNIEEEIQKISRDESLKKLVASYFLGYSYYFSVGIFTTELSKSKSEGYLKKAIAYDKDAELLTGGTYRKLHSETKKEYRKEKSELSKRVRDLISDDFYKVFQKIDLKVEHITFVIGLTTTLFIITGYIYCKFYLGFFGIEVAEFFSLGDYVAMSVDKIYIAAIGTAVGIYWYLQGLHDRAKERIRDLHFDVERRHSNYPRVIVMGGLVVCTVLGYWMDLQGRHQSAAFLGLFILMLIYNRLPTERLFKNDIYITLFVIAILYFGAHIYGSIMMDIDFINRSNVDTLKRYRIVFNKDIGVDEDSLVLLGRSSDHFFLYDKQKSKAYVISKQDVRLFETIRSSSSKAKQ